MDWFLCDNGHHHERVNRALSTHLRVMSCKYELPLRVTSYELRIKSSDLKKRKFTSCRFLFTSCKVILRDANLFYELEIKLRVGSCFLRIAICFL